MPILTFSCTCGWEAFTPFAGVQPHSTSHQPQRLLPACRSAQGSQSLAASTVGCPFPTLLASEPHGIPLPGLPTTSTAPCHLPSPPAQKWEILLWQSSWPMATLGGKPPMPACRKLAGNFCGKESAGAILKNTFIWPEVGICLEKHHSAPALLHSPLYFG